jgi:diguanylate cyclase (GGDEF)-like protein
MATLDTINRLICQKHQTSFMLFDKEFKLIEFSDSLKELVDDISSLSSRRDIREIVWSFIGLEDDILQLLDKKNASIHIPMIIKNDNYYDLDIELLDEDVFIAYFIQKSKNSIEYINMIKEINKKTLIYESSKDKEKQRLINKELISFTVDLDGMIVECNDALAYFLNLETNKIKGLHFSTFFQTRNNTLDDKNIIFTAKDSMDKTIFFNATILPLKRDDKIYENMIICQDISYLQQIKQNLEYVSELDTLTALPNRNLFLQTVEKLVEDKESFVIAIFDIRNFDTINKEYGYHAGDMLLKHIANLLQESIRPEDTLARIGGDEFAIALKSFIENFEKKSQEIEMMIEKSPLIYTHEDTIAFAFDIVAAHYPEEATDINEMINMLEKKLARKKLA